MIRLTGDVHGEIYGRFNPVMMRGEAAWTGEDILIVLGDFGLVFYPETEPYLSTVVALERRQLAFLEEKRYEILFVDGNHENFDRLFACPETERYGGRVRQIGKNVFWLQRGQVYTIGGKTFFCMGGALSIDRYRRQAGISWWPRELPSAEEYRAAAANLDACGRRVDYVLTHTCPESIVRLMGRAPDPHEAELCGFLDWIWHEISFTHWYFGHWHVDTRVHPKATALYFDVVGLPPPKINEEEAR